MMPVMVLCPKEDEIQSEFHLFLSEKETMDLFEEATCARTVGMDGQVVRDRRNFWLVLDVTARLTLTCRRCLEPFEREVRGHIEQRYVATQPSENPPSEEDVLTCDGERLNVAGPLQEALTLAMPVFPLCSNDCGGICSRCGRRVEKPPCPCEEQSEDFGNRLGDQLVK